MSRSEDHPPWLKAMENGSIGEARSKAFLLDRFWVLERSVDIDGADFIIQRRLTQKTLLDREAPRLGIVQAKFFGHPATAHHVHTQYVLDERHNTRDEFFLLCHFGDEENPQMFMLGARDIRDNFSTVEVSGIKKFKIAYGDLYGGSKFNVSSKRNALDRIERQLQVADFIKNRNFLSAMLPNAATDLTAILPLYREPIDNWWGDLAVSFSKLKKTARKAMLDVEEAHEQLSRLTAEIDPLEAEKILEDLAYACRDGRGNWSIPLPSDLDADDFFTVCREHKYMVDRLNAEGLLDSFLRIKDQLRRNIFAFLKPMFPFDKNLVHHFVLKFNPRTLDVESIDSEAVGAAEFFGVSDVKNKYGHVEVGDEIAKIISAQPGRIEYRWFPSRYGLSRSGENTFEMYLKADFFLYRECMMTVFEQKYGPIP